MVIGQWKEGVVAALLVTREANKDGPMGTLLSVVFFFIGFCCKCILSL